MHYINYEGNMRKNHTKKMLPRNQRAFAIITNIEYKKIGFDTIYRIDLGSQKKIHILFEIGNKNIFGYPSPRKRYFFRKLIPDSAQTRYTHPKREP